MNKHLKKLVLAVLTIAVLTASLPVFSAFAANPTVSAQQVPVPADYSWLIVVAVVLVVLIAIMLYILFKQNKKKKRIQQAM